MRTVVDDRLVDDANIIFEGNTHHESIKMKYEDFAKLEKPIVASISESGLGE